MIKALFVLILPAFASETNVIGQFDDPGTCICDVTLASCDAYCCCDSTCLSLVTSEWDSNCAAESLSSFGNIYCVETSEVYKINSRRGMDSANGTNTQDCIQIDTTAMIDSFHSVVSSISASQVTERTTESVTYRSTLAFISPTISATYASGDIISELFSQTAAASGGCVQSKIQFLSNVSPVSCSRSGFLSDICTSFLSTSVLTQGAKVESVIKRNYITQVDSDGSLTSSTTFSSDTCNLAVVEANYKIYTSSNQKSIDSISVSYVVSDITSTSFLDVSQVFSVRFFTSTSAKETSGNPGYLIGKPLNAIVNSVSGDFFFQGKSVNGECSSSYMTGPVLTYGTNRIYSCYLSMTYTELNNYCKTSLDITSVSLFANHASFTDIGKWGIVSSSTSDDWIGIDSTSPSKTVTWSSPGCTLENTLVYDIYYAYIGALDNPQPKVVLAKRYYKSGTWVFSGPYSSRSQNFQYSVVVNYIPYDTRYDPVYEKLRKDKIMPQNLLEPFRTSAGTIICLGLALIFN